MNEELSLTIPNPAELMRMATDCAGVSKEIVLKTAMTIQGRKYIKVEGWQAIASAHGCTASSRAVEKVEGGIRAIGEVRRMSDGALIAQAEGFVGEDETKTWALRPEYAKRAMAQTRAISRACRSAFAHVVVLIDANLSTTPAEEVPDGGFIDVQSHSKPSETAPKPQSAPKPAQSTANGNLSEGDRRNLSFESFTIKDGKTTGGKPWKRFDCVFKQPNGNEFRANTFSETLGASLDVLQGHTVTATVKPSKKEGYYDLLAIEPAIVQPSPPLPGEEEQTEVPF